MKKSIFRTLGFSLAISFCFAAHAEAARDMKLLSPLAFIGKKVEGAVKPDALRGLDQLQVDTEGQTPDGLPMADTAGNGPDAVAKSCAEYKTLRDKGYAVATTAEQVAESFYISACGTAGILAHSKAATQSKFTNDALTPADLATLPALLLQYVAMEDPGPDSQCAKAASFKACVAERAGKVTVDGNGIKYADEGYTAYFTPALKADIDGDGWEDLVINYSYYPSEGSFRVYDQVCVSRKGGDAVAKVISCNSPLPSAKP